MLPFQYLFIACAAMWCLSQVLPNHDIQRKMQSTGGLMMLTIGMIITGIITIPQFEESKRTSEPATLASFHDVQNIKSQNTKRKHVESFGPDDLEADIKRLSRY